MNAREINKIVAAICNADWRCPVNEAGADCDCNGSKGKCPIKDALLLANQPKKKGGAK